jgi:hypothetical protein
MYKSCLYIKAIIQNHGADCVLKASKINHNMDEEKYRIPLFDGKNWFSVQKKWVTSAIFKKYLQCVLAAKILTLYFVVCTLAVKKKIRAGFDMPDRTIPLSVHSAQMIYQFITNSSTS